MNSAGTTGTNSRAKGPLNISAVGPRFGLTKPAAAARVALTLAALSLLLLIASRPAQAQTETVLYNFTGSDGYEPQSSLVSDGAGNLYGTTLLGGLGCPGNQLGCGVVFEISPNGSGGWNETMLHSFSGPPDGANPFLAPMILDKAGNLYGTTEFGGTYNYGAVFELSPAGTSWTMTILYSFSSYNDGVHPAAGLIMDAAGNLYGITSEYQSPGSVFELSPSDSGWTYTVIYGVPTWGGLAMDSAGNIFGYTGSGSGTVFELSPNGNGGWNPAVIHTFTGAPDDGSGPEGNLVLDQAGNLYGATYYGGARNSGTVFRLIRPTKKWQRGEWKEQILRSFGNGKDGSNPYAGIVFDAEGNIYGTTNGGGELNDGTVFELAAQADKNWYKEKVLWSFDGPDGFWPRSAPVLGREGNLYGTTVFGGSSNDGVVFEVTP